MNRDTFLCMKLWETGEVCKVSWDSPNIHVQPCPLIQLAFQSLLIAKDPTISKMYLFFTGSFQSSLLPRIRVNLAILWSNKSKCNIRVSHPSPHTHPYLHHRGPWPQGKGEPCAPALSPTPGYPWSSHPFQCVWNCTSALTTVAMWTTR